MAKEDEGAGISQRLAALTDQVGSIVQTVRQTVTDQLQLWSTAFFVDARAAAAAIASKIDYVSDAMLGGCNDDGNDDIGNVQLPVSRAALIDQVRASKPAVYAALVLAADEVHKASPTTARQTLSDGLDAVEKATRPPEPVPDATLSS